MCQKCEDEGREPMSYEEQVKRLAQQLGIDESIARLALQVQDELKELQWAGHPLLEKQVVLNNLLQGNAGPMQQKLAAKVMILLELEESGRKAAVAQIVEMMKAQGVLEVPEKGDFVINPNAKDPMERHLAKLLREASEKARGKKTDHKGH